MDLLIKNGTIVNARETMQADVAVCNGVITQIGMHLHGQSHTKIIDASGKMVIPGAIDAHTHLQMPYGSTMSADSYFSGTRAAACGGTTMVFDFVMQEKGENMLDAVKRRDALCKGDAVIDYAFHVAITDVSAGLLDCMDQVVAYGIPSFKVYMVYDFGVDDGVLYQVLEKAKSCGAIIGVHAENKAMIQTLTDKYVSQGLKSPWYHYLSRPEFVESEAVLRAIFLAKEVGAPLYIVHLASQQGVQAVAQAKKQGYPIYAETCPHYLAFNNQVYKRDDGRIFVCSPPVKGQSSQDALWNAIAKGQIDTIATDHCPFQLHEKNWGKDDFTKIPNGCGSIENMYPYMLSMANQGKISFAKAIQLCCENPSKLFGCESKGSITVGKDADIVIYDRDVDFTITHEKMHSECDHTIWEGMVLKGYPIMTFSRGKLVYENGVFQGEAGWGRFIKRKIDTCYTDYLG